MEYRKKGILALMKVLSGNWEVTFFENQIHVNSKTEREYFLNIHQLCEDILSEKATVSLKFLQFN